MPHRYAAPQAIRRSLLALLLVVAAFPPPARAWVDFRGTMPINFKRHFVEYEYDRIWRTIAPKRKNDHFTLTVLCYKSTDKNNQFVARMLPEWGGGGAVGRDTILLPVDKQPVLGRDAFQVLVHEMVHIVIARAYPRAPVPRWFHEGLAMTLAGELDFREQVTLSHAAITNKLMPLGSIDSVNSFSQPLAHVAYAQSHAAVTILMEKYGMDGAAAILNKADRYNDFWRAFKEEMGMDETEFGILVDSETRKRYTFMFLFADPYLFWLILAIVFLIGGSLALWRWSVQKKMMDAAEAGDEAADIQVDESKAQPQASALNDPAAAAAAMAEINAALRARDAAQAAKQEAQADNAGKESGEQGEDEEEDDPDHPVNQVEDAIDQDLEDEEESGDGGEGKDGRVGR